mmetsp:Transcript_16837/g.31284  ORF Transcript_16837/g.31284 Transcript_16837/m.31284 type:complete len:275 (-) Transcript_16837:65-889(-)
MCTASCVTSFTIRSNARGKSSLSSSACGDGRGTYLWMLKTPTLAAQSLAPMVVTPPDRRGASVSATVSAEFARKPEAIQLSTSSASIEPSGSNDSGMASGILSTATRSGQKKAAQMSRSCAKSAGSGSPGPNGSRCRHWRSLVGPICLRYSSKALLKASNVCMSSGCRLSQSFDLGSGIGSNQTSANFKTLCNMNGKPPLLPTADRRAKGVGTSNLQGPRWQPALALQHVAPLPATPPQPGNGPCAWKAASASPCWTPAQASNSGPQPRGCGGL